MKAAMLLRVRFNQSIRALHSTGRPLPSHWSQSRPILCITSTGFFGLKLLAVGERPTTKKRTKENSWVPRAVWLQAKRIQICRLLDSGSAISVLKFSSLYSAFDLHELMRNCSGKKLVMCGLHGLQPILLASLDALHTEQYGGPEDKCRSIAGYMHTCSGT
eukprot:6174571-Pleurochrysis_carterae.AAC.3